MKLWMQDMQELATVIQTLNRGEEWEFHGTIMVADKRCGKEMGRLISEEGCWFFDTGEGECDIVETRPQ